MREPAAQVLSSAFAREPASAISRAPGSRRSGGGELCRVIPSSGRELASINVLPSPDAVLDPGLCGRGVRVGR